MERPPIKNVGDVIAILKRRKWSLILPAVGVFALSAAIAFMLSPIYQSTSTILIEDQEMPRDYVISAVTSYAEQRLQTITQRIMSTPKLLEIINRFNLYADLREKKTTEEIVARMREKDIKFQTVSGDIIDRRTGSPSRATIAFTLSYKGKNPGVVQQVSNVLASLYLEENLRVREKQAKGTSRFLEEELRDVRNQLARIDTRITPFKAKYIQELPEHLQINLQGLERVERDMDRVRSEHRRAQEREDYLRTELEHLRSQPSALKPKEPNPNKILLKELRLRLIQLQSKFTDRYPDVIKVKIEIAELEKKLASEPEEEEEDPQDGDGTNPTIVGLSSQLAAVQSDVESLKREMERLTQLKKMYQGRIESTPGVEEQYKSITQERNNLQAKYDDLMRKLLEAKVSQGLEKEQMGERFTLIDAARFPERPVSPNIPAILLIGLVLGIGSGIGTASLREFSDQSVRTVEDLSLVTQAPVLGGIPVIVTTREKLWQQKKRRLTIALVLGILVVGTLIFHFLIMDLDIFWAKLMRRMVP